jgi:hypothetical protein
MVENVFYPTENAKETFELILALIHLRPMHNKIYDSKIPYTIKYFGYANIFNIGNSEAGNMTSNPLSNQILPNMILSLI